MSAIPEGVNGEDVSEEEEQVSYYKKRAEMKRSRGGKSEYKSKDWINKKKDRQQKQGKDVRESSKFTGRKRREEVRKH